MSVAQLALRRMASLLAALVAVNAVSYIVIAYLAIRQGGAVRPATYGGAGGW